MNAANAAIAPRGWKSAAALRSAINPLLYTGQNDSRQLLCARFPIPNLAPKPPHQTGD